MCFSTVNISICIKCVPPLALKNCFEVYSAVLPLYLEIYSEGWLRTNLYNKGDDFNFPLVKFPFIYIVTFLQHLHIDNEILKLVLKLPIIISLLTIKLLYQIQRFLVIVEVVTFQNSRLPSCLGEQLWNICVTDDHGYEHGPLVAEF